MSTTTTATAGLEPEVIWKHFGTLSSIPRRSREEIGVLDYIKGFAEENGLRWRQDEAGNMVVTRPCRKTRPRS